MTQKTAFYGAMSKVHDADNASLAFSRAVSVILLIVYGFYLAMHLKSHESRPDDLLEKGGDGQDGLERASEGREQSALLASILVFVMLMRKN
jgi:Ca2+/H+ antiporter